MSNTTLREIFYTHDDRLIHKWDHYFEIYEKYFSKYKGQEVHMLEIGISHGGSIQLWKKYFGEKLKLYSIDINPECKKFEDEQTTIFIGSQSDTVFLDDVLSKIPKLDIVLDDGGHTMQQQIVSFEKLYLNVKEGGVYLVEDTHTSYWHEFHGGLKTAGSFIEYSKNIVDSIYSAHLTDKSNILINDITKNIDSISFYDSVVVFEKLQRKEPFHIRKGTETITSYEPEELKEPTLLMKLKAKMFGEKKHTFEINSKGTIK